MMNSRPSARATDAIAQDVDAGKVSHNRVDGSDYGSTVRDVRDKSLGLSTGTPNLVRSLLCPLPVDVHDRDGNALRR